MSDISVETYYGPRENPYLLKRDTSVGMYYWSSSPKVPKGMEGRFTTKDKAVAALIRHLKSDNKPYHKNVKEVFGGNPWDESWRLPPPVKHA